MLLCLPVPLFYLSWPGYNIENMKRLLAPLLLFCVLAVGLIFIAPAQEVFADSKSQVCEGVNAASGGSGCTDGRSDINNVITVFLNLFSVIIGIVAVVMIMVGGYKYITANGDSSNITSAKHTIIYALVGLVIVAMAQFMVQFVLDKAT